MFKVGSAVVTSGDIEVGLLLSNPGKPQVSKKMHDLNAALRTIQLCTEALQNGYKFDDALAHAKVEAMARAANTLKQEVDVLLQAYKNCGELL